MFKYLKEQKVEENNISKTSNKISNGLMSIFSSKKINKETLDELEDLLISADINIYVIADIMKFLLENRYEKETTIDDIKNIIYSRLEKSFLKVEDFNVNFEGKPYVVMFLGVNGSGKTTFIGKIANQLIKNSKKVLLAACDTFRAGAKEQLKIWADRAQCDIIMPEKEGEDPASLAFKAYKKAENENYDVLLIDTAGRLQNNTNLMQELTKIQNVLKKIDNNIPNATLLTLDATVGQNSLNQFELLNEAVHIDGVIMNKLDGTAKGGTLISIVDKFKKPILAIGTGEKIDDIENFNYNIYLHHLLNIK